MSGGQLRFLCVGAGRDGTLTVAAHINEILRSVGAGGECVHEMHSRDLYELQCDLVERLERTETQKRIYETIADFPCIAAAGTGYAGVLPAFAELYPSLKLIHLKRRDKQAFIASQVRNSQLYPETYINYTTDIGVMRRIAAFHTGEATPEEWRALSLPDKFAWFYEYTHRVVVDAYPLFSAVLKIETEDLSSADTLRRLARFVAGDAAEAPRPRRLNGHTLIDIYDFPAEQRAFAQWMFGRVQSHDIAENNTVLVDHILNSTIAWLGYLQTGVAGKFHEHYTRAPEQVRHEAQAVLARLDFYRGEIARFISEMDTPLVHRCRVAGDVGVRPDVSRRPRFTSE